MRKKKNSVPSPQTTCIILQRHIIDVSITECLSCLLVCRVAVMQETALETSSYFIQLLTGREHNRIMDFLRQLHLYFVISLREIVRMDPNARVQNNRSSCFKRKCKDQKMVHRKCK